MPPVTHGFYWQHQQAFSKAVAAVEQVRELTGGEVVTRDLARLERVSTRTHCHLEFVTSISHRDPLTRATFALRSSAPGRLFITLSNRDFEIV